MNSRHVVLPRCRARGGNPGSGAAVLRSGRGLGRPAPCAARSLPSGGRRPGRKISARPFERGSWRLPSRRCRARRHPEATAIRRASEPDSPVVRECRRHPGPRWRRVRRQAGPSLTAAVRRPSAGGTRPRLSPSCGQLLLQRSLLRAFTTRGIRRREPGTPAASTSFWYRLQHVVLHHLLSGLARRDVRPDDLDHRLQVSR